MAEEAFAIRLTLCLLLLTGFVKGQNLRSGPLDPKTVSKKCVRDFSVPFLSQYLEDTIIFDRFFENDLKCDGVIVEIGGLNGKAFSNSWFYQYALNWRTLLVEANPDNFALMVKNRPDAMNHFGAICKGESVKFQPAISEATGGVINDMSQYHKDHYVDGSAKLIDVPCTLLTELLHKNNIQHVDLFYLDIEGAELSTLQTFDWPVPIDIFVIEMDGTNTQKDEAVRALMKSQGYITPFSILDECRKKKSQCMPSDVFVKEDVWKKTNRVTDA